MKVSQLVADWLATVNPRVYSVCGAGAMYLNDAICHHPKLQVTAMHHEQAATFAAEADARVSGKPGIVHVTAGPGGSNTITGLACAYVDSIPLIVIAGQVTTSTLKTYGMRQLGMNELDMIALAKPVTKYAVTVTHPEDILWELGNALHIATHGRPGPVFIEIPIDVQSAEVDPEILRTFYAEKPIAGMVGVGACLEMLSEARRPVLMIGNGVRLAGAVDECVKLANVLYIPIVSSWNGSDIIPTDHQHYIGRAGIFGCRPGNFTVQGADLILAIGTRLSVPQTGHAQQLFAQNAKKIMVDIDRNEANKLRPDLAIVADAKDFIAALAASKIVPNSNHRSWLYRCIGWRDRYPVMCEEYRTETDGVNSYLFVEELAKNLPDDAIVVTDVGAAFISTMQSMPVKKGQRLFHSGGVSPMGWGLPASVGACLAGGGRKTVCLTGDGGVMLNIQELQTIAHHSLPIAIFIFANNGYLTIQHMQGNHFKRESISSPESGMSLPDFYEVARAFGISAVHVHDPFTLQCVLPGALKTRVPCVVVVHMPKEQLLIPRVQTRVEDGKFIPTAIDDMWPYLERDELVGVRA